MDIENFLASAHPYAESSKRTYRDVIPAILERASDPASLTAAELVNLLATSGWGNARQRLALAAIHKYLAWTYGQSHPALSAKIKRIEGKPMRSFSQDTLNILLASFDRHSIKGARNLAIASTLINTGIRASELCRLQQAYTDTEHGILQVLTKGGEWRFAIFTEETAAHIEHWKRYREALTPNNGLLFLSLRRNCIGRALTPEGLNTIIGEWGDHLGIKLSPHDFRRSFATIASENGGPDRAIMEGGGWQSQKTFNRYTRNYQLRALKAYLPDTKLKENV